MNEILVVVLLAVMASFVVGLLVAIRKDQEIAVLESLVASANANAAACRDAERKAFDAHRDAQHALSISRLNAANLERGLAIQRGETAHYQDSAHQWYQAWNRVANSKAQQEAHLMASWKTLQGELDKCGAEKAFWRQAAMAKAQDLKALHTAHLQLLSGSNAIRTGYRRVLLECSKLRSANADLRESVYQVEDILDRERAWADQTSDRVCWYTDLANAFVKQQPKLLPAPKETLLSKWMAAADAAAKAAWKQAEEDALRF